MKKSKKGSNPNSLERAAKREAFVRKHVELLDKGLYIHDTEIIELARKELGYSSNTWGKDILRWIEKVYYDIRDTIKPDYDTDLPKRYCD